ncbi:MAG: hypothetical protein PHU46_16295 [Rhodocyclaceae bacterium]|nr:hypothetical protein [Rhodocyclaceae bacterium]
MKKTILAAALALASMAAHALQPYVAGDKVAGGDLNAAMSAAEQKLTAAGFTVIGRHLPKGLPQYGSVVVTDAGLTDAMRSIGGSAVIGAPIRVGVQADGTLSYENLEYWERAYLRKDYGKAEAAVKATSAKLGKTLGAGKAFGGDVSESSLAKYHYMIGMEYFDEKSDLKEYPSFEAAVKAVEANLAKGVAHTSKVYALSMPEKKIAVFGVALNDPETGEGWWAKKIGPDHVAGLPWEVFVVDGKVYGLYGRYRTALAWPELGMGQFMGISNHPDTTKKMLEAVAGAQ